MRNRQTERQRLTIPGNNTLGAWANLQVVSRNEIKNIVLLTLCAIVICKRTEKTKVSVNSNLNTDTL